MLLFEFTFDRPFAGVCNEESFDENCFGPFDSGSDLGTNLFAGKFGLDDVTAGAVLFTGLTVSRLLEMVFSGISLEPVAFSLGIPLANKPPRPSGDGVALVEPP